MVSDLISVIKNQIAINPMSLFECVIYLKRSVIEQSNRENIKSAFIPAF